MITVESPHSLESVEAAICRAAQKHEAHVVAITPFSSLAAGQERSAPNDTVSFTVCHTELVGALLAADTRFAALLPCRIAAFRSAGGTTLAAVAPSQFCALLNRPDLERLVAPLETLLAELMEEAAHPPAAQPPHARTDHSLLGAREGQGSMRAAIPQRIDCRGTKIEDIAGTGKVDAPGG